MDGVDDDVSTPGDVDQVTGLSLTGLLVFCLWSKTCFLPMNEMLTFYFLLYVDDTATKQPVGSDQTSEGVVGEASTEGNNSDVTGTFDLGYNFKCS